MPLLRADDAITLILMAMPSLPFFCRADADTPLMLTLPFRAPRRCLIAAFF